MRASKASRGRLLVTGGLGFIGSSTVLELMRQGYDVVIVDSGINADEHVASEIAELAKKSCPLILGDIGNRLLLDEVFDRYEPEGVLHFAGLKSVPESIKEPLRYYHVNVGGTANLLEVMEQHGVKKMIFSSTAAVYGRYGKMPLTEDAELMPENPYGSSKAMIEKMLTDLHEWGHGWDITLLRYFNPVGSFSSGHLAERPKGMKGNLVPAIVEAALGSAPALSIYGSDYETPDGTAIRDYVHITDLAHGHVAALEKLGGLQVYNLGTGHGYSVLEVVQIFERVNGVKVPYQVVGRRPGDVAVCYADPGRAARELGWRAEKNLEQMCRDAWAGALLNNRQDTF